MPVQLLPPRTVVPAVVGPGYPTLAFDIANPVQTDFLGLGAVNMAFLEFPEYGLTPAQKTAEYDVARTSGLRLARTAVKTDWAMPTFPSGAADWNSTKMGYLYAFCAANQARGISVVLTFGWHYPGSVCDIDLNGVIPSCVPSAANETTWKQWLSSLLHQCINVRGYTNIVACFFFTEPNNLVADPAATHAQIPGAATAGNYYASLVTAARAQIAADDASRTPILPRIKLIGAEEHHYTGDPWLTYVKAAAGAQFDAYAKHAYEDTPDFGPLGLVAANSPDFATYLSRWRTWRADAQSKQVWSDEWNALVAAGGDADTTGYRRTADAGMRMGRGIVAQMKSGVQAPFIWTLRDEKFEGTGGYTQQFGIKLWPPGGVKPSWYCATMLANLCGGGNGTRVYDIVGGETSALRGVAVFIPYGDRWSTSVDGDWTFVVLNEGSLAQWVNLRFTSTLNRTFYRYTYSGEHVPVAAADPAYLLPWDQRYLSVGRSIPANLAPARAVVAYSTFLTAAGVENLALSATVTADSTGYGQASNIARGNRSNVVSPLNSWCKADNAAHYAQLAWPSSVTLSRLELAFVGTTAGVVWADYATAATPAPAADYTIEYWTGASWVQVASVTGNAAPNRTHTFAPVSTTGLRLNVLSAAATAHVNNIGAYAA